MTTSRTLRLALVLTMASALGGCAAVRRHQASSTEDLLAAAGFTPQPADTPQRRERLQALPPLQLVSQPKGEGKTVYRYTDPYSCQCFYVGDQQAYAEYKRLALEQRVADERIQAAEIEESSLEESSMEWGVWDPVGAWW